MEENSIVRYQEITTDVDDFDVSNALVVYDNTPANVCTVENYAFRPGHIPVLVFGSSKVGKSSVINLLSNSWYLKTDGITSKGCTLETVIMMDVTDRGEVFDIVDTAGLNEAGNGGISCADSLKNILSIAEVLSTGISLAIYVRKKGAITNLDIANTTLFHKALVDEKIPLIVVETGHDGEDVPDLKRFTLNNKADMEERLNAKDLVCVCTKAPHEISNPMLRNWYSFITGQSAQLIWDSIHRHARKPAVEIKDGKCWINAWDVFCVATGIPFRSTRYQEIGSLMKDVGIPRIDAERIILRFSRKHIARLFQAMRDWLPPSWFDNFVGYFANAFVRRENKLGEHK